MIKNYFRILKKPHAYLHTILKTPVKFQKDWTETVGGVKGTKYPLKTRNHAPRATRHAPRATHHAPRTTPHGKPKTVSLHFSSKRRGTTNQHQHTTFYFLSLLLSFFREISMLIRYCMHKNQTTTDGQMDIWMDQLSENSISSPPSTQFAGADMKCHMKCQDLFSLKNENKKWQVVSCSCDKHFKG